MPRIYRIELDSAEAVVVRVALRREMDRRVETRPKPAWKDVTACAQSVIAKLSDPMNMTTVPLHYRPGICGAVDAGFGPADVHCAEPTGHNGSHRDAEGREWFNLSEVIRDAQAEETLPHGLCANREDHVEHVHESASLGTFWCHADQAKRLPFAMGRKNQ